MTRSRWMLLLRIACGVALLWWALRKAQLGDIRELPLWDLHTGWFLLAVLLGGLSVLGWAIRWRMFLRMGSMPISFGESIRLTLFADFFNLYFLGPLGADGIRAVFLNKQYPNRKIAIAQSILLDHASGLMGGTLLYFLFTRTQTAWITAGSSLIPEIALVILDVALGGLFIATLAAAIVIAFPAAWKMVESCRPVGWTLAALRPFLYLREYRGLMAKAQLVSLVSLVCGYGAYWAAGQAVGQAVLARHILAIMPMVDAIASIPLTISGLGVRENLFVELLAHHLDEGAHGALAVSLLGFATIGIWGLAGGVWLAMHRLRNRSQSPVKSQEAQQT